jgi:hypothetical protein
MEQKLLKAWNALPQSTQVHLCKQYGLKWYGISEELLIFDLVNKLPKGLLVEEPKETPKEKDEKEKEEFIKEEVKKADKEEEVEVAEEALSEEDEEEEAPEVLEEEPKKEAPKKRSRKSKK